jgi:PmbA protein
MLMEDEILSLAQERGARAEVFGADENRTVVEFRANEFHSQESRLTHGYGLRVVKNGRVGFSSTTNPDVVEELVEAAVDTAEFGKPCRFDFPGPTPPPPVTTFDNRVIMLPARKMIEWGKELVDATRARVPDIKLDVSFVRTYRDVVVMNSAGLDACFSRSEFGVMVTGLLVHDGLVWIPEYENLSNGKPFAVGPLVDRIEGHARKVRSRARLSSGTYPVIVAPSAVPNLLMPFEVAVDGKLLEKGTSPLIGKEGQRLLDAKITIADNRLRDFALASSPLDGEGTPCRRNVLFDHGVFQGFLFDAATGAACRKESSGSAARDYSSQPRPGTSNVELAVGTAKLEDAIRGIRQGLVIYECIGGGQSNLLAGDVTLNVSLGYKIENGVVTGRVKDAMIAGNVYEMFRNVEAVGDAEHDYGTYFVPFVKFPALRVATRE